MPKMMGGCSLLQTSSPRATVVSSGTSGSALRISPGGGGSVPGSVLGTNRLGRSPARGGGLVSAMLCYDSTKEKCEFVSGR